MRVKNRRWKDYAMIWMRDQVHEFGFTLLLPFWYRSFNMFLEKSLWASFSGVMYSNFMSSASSKSRRVPPLQVSNDPALISRAISDITCVLIKEQQNWMGEGRWRWTQILLSHKLNVSTNLILHERYQRGEHDCGTIVISIRQSCRELLVHSTIRFEHMRAQQMQNEFIYTFVTSKPAIGNSYLITQTFPSSGRHQHKAVALVHQGINYRFLIEAEACVSKDVSAVHSHLTWPRKTGVVVCGVCLNVYMRISEQRQIRVKARSKDKYPS